MFNYCFQGPAERDRLSQYYVPCNGEIESRTCSFLSGSRRNDRVAGDNHRIRSQPTPKEDKLDGRLSLRTEFATRAEEHGEDTEDAVSL